MRATYEILFRLLESVFQDWRRSKITMDFEKAAIKAIRQVYPGIKIKECYFHYNRCLIRESKILKISTPAKKRHVSRCAGMAQLPRNFIDSGIHFVMRKSPSGEDIKKFNTFFF